MSLVALLTNNQCIRTLSIALLMTTTVAVSQTFRKGVRCQTLQQRNLKSRSRCLVNLLPCSIKRHISPICVTQFCLTSVRVMPRKISRTCLRRKINIFSVTASLKALSEDEKYDLIAANTREVLRPEIIRQFPICEVPRDALGQSNHMPPARSSFRPCYQDR